MDHPKVPKFGTWDDKVNDVPNYTVYFDKARENKGGKKMTTPINPNDPRENPELFEKKSSTDDESRSRNMKFSEEPAVKQQGPVRPAYKGNAESQGDYGTGRSGQRHVRSAKASAGSDNSFDRSPLHPRAKAAVGRGGTNSVGHGTSGRARQRPPVAANRGDESPDVGATVPKFGDWDETDPQKTPDFTQAFERVRDERNNNGTGTPRHDAYGTRTKQTDQPKKCCFPWW